MTTATHAPAAARTHVRPLPGALSGRGWSAYLLIAAMLAPFVVPPGPAQLAVLDAFNLAAIVVFFGAVLLKRVRVVLPFVLPVVVIGVGSLLAITNAISVGASVMSLAQDAYLYVWFVALVAVMSRHGDLYAFRLGWVLVSVVIAAVFIVQAAQAGAFPSQLLAADGFRPAGTFYGANMGADYLVLSMFVAFSLLGRANRALLVASLGILAIALLVTKSNGSIISLFVGLGASGLFLALRADGRRSFRLGAIVLVLAFGLVAVVAQGEWGSGASGLATSGQGSVLGRMSKSSASRSTIWGQLGSQLARHPLGIGPGNSVLQAVEIGHRVRKGTSFQSKEAHSDYMAYAVERGPIGALGFLLWTGAGILLVLGIGSRGSAVERRPDEAGARRLRLLRAAFVGGLIASAVHSTVIEKHHFRHYWLFLALACATTAGATFRPAEARGR